MLNITAFLLGREVAKSAGADGPRANQLALLPSFLDMSLPMSLVMTQVLARRETAPASTTVSTDVQLVLLPDVTDAGSVEYAKNLLQECFHLQVQTEDVLSDSDEVLIGQDPEPGSLVPEGSTVTLYVNEGNYCQQDTTPPTITVVSPADGNTAQSTKPMLLVQVNDDMSGVAEIAISLEDANGNNVDGQTTLSQDNTVEAFVPDGDLEPGGTYTATATATDNAGNSAESNWRFTVAAAAVEQQ